MLYNPMNKFKDDFLRERRSKYATATKQGMVASQAAQRAQKDIDFRKRGKTRLFDQLKRTKIKEKSTLPPRGVGVLGNKRLWKRSGRGRDKYKDYFMDFTKQNKISIHQFIFEHHKRQTDNNPSSMAIFEKRLRTIAATIKDEYIKKYVLEYFLERVFSLTPNVNNKKKFIPKKTRSLKLTQKYFNESKSISQIEIKEFSLLYLILNNLKIFQENFHLIENIKLFTNENKLVFDAVLSRLKNDGVFTIDELLIDSQLIDKIFKFASIKHILNNNQNNHDKIFDLLEEIMKDLKNYELELRIEELESKFAKDLSESTFDEIRKLKKSQNIN